jgi:hypothetical protein
MEMKTIVTNSREIFLESDNGSCVVNNWSNLCGANVMLHSNDSCQSLKLAASLRWEEIDLLLVALAAARSA